MAEKIIDCIGIASIREGGENEGPEVEFSFPYNYFKESPTENKDFLYVFLIYLIIFF